jgi:hypothetical protein
VKVGVAFPYNSFVIPKGTVSVLSFPLRPHGGWGPEPRTPRRLQASGIALVSISTMTIKLKGNLATGQCNFVVLANVIYIL